jgi:shikimate dehydrogenase
MGVPYAEVIGDPIAHSKSPLIHKFWLEKLGLEGDYRRERVTADELQSYFERRKTDRDWRGCNVTIPHKVAVLGLIDRVTDDVEGAGAVNAVLNEGGQLVGGNTDVVALRHDVPAWATEAALFEVPIILFGAGGAARAVLQSIRDVEGVQVVIVNRDTAKSERLLAEFGIAGRSLPMGTPLPGAWAIINASGLGMIGYPPLPVSESDISGQIFVYDLVYSPIETDLLKLARRRGCPTLDGLNMLIGQARAAFEWFFRVPPPPETEFELRELLTR